MHPNSPLRNLGDRRNDAAAGRAGRLLAALRHRAARWLALALPRFGGVGSTPRVLGTAGSTVGIGQFWLLVPTAGTLYGVVVLALGAAGIGTAEAGERYFGRDGDPRIAVDEVVGQRAPVARLAGRDRGRSAASFVAFRCLDVAGRGWLRWEERRLRGGVVVGIIACDRVTGGLSAGLLTAGLGIGAGGEPR